MCNCSVYHFILVYCVGHYESRSLPKGVCYQCASDVASPLPYPKKNLLSTPTRLARFNYWGCRQRALSTPYLQNIIGCIPPCASYNRHAELAMAMYWQYTVETPLIVPYISGDRLPERLQPRGVGSKGLKPRSSRFLGVRCYTLYRQGIIVYTAVAVLSHTTCLLHACCKWSARLVHDSRSTPHVCP